MTPFEFGEKCASGDDFREYLQQSLAQIPAQARTPMSLLGTVGVLGLNAYYSHRMLDSIKKLKRGTKADTKKILQHFKLQRMPVIEYPEFENAAYIEPNQFQGDQGLQYRDKIIADAALKNPKMLRHLPQHGAVIYDKKFNTPAIMAHEAGHADIGNMPWYAPSRINQSYLRALSGTVAPFIAPTAGLVAGALTRNPFLGLGAGALTGAALNAPTLINEWQATHRAHDYIDNKLMRPADRAKAKKTLQHAYNTYLTAAAVPAAVLGAGAGYFANNASARDIFGRLKAAQATPTRV
jgi:hypothetical protein